MAVRAGDVANVKNTSGPIPKGRHTAQITEAKETVSNGREVWELRFKIVASAGDDGTGRELREWIYWTPNAAFRGQLLLDAVGVDFRAMPEDEGVPASACKDKVCDIDLVHADREVDDRDNPGAKKTMTFAEIAMSGFHKASTTAPAPAATANNAAAVQGIW